MCEEAVIKEDNELDDWKTRLSKRLNQEDEQE